MRAAGKISTILQQEAARQVDRLISELVVEAVRLWRAERFHRFSDLETSYNVRVFHFCDIALHENQQRWPLTHIVYDATQPTREMLLGEADPSGVSRPDLTILMGSHRIRVEAKRLRSTGGLPRLYVHQGMARFIDGRYQSTRPHPGIMIGYVEDGQVSEAVRRVNEILIADPIFGPEHVLQPSAAQFCQPDEVPTYDSQHGPALRLRHFEIPTVCEAD